jgi:Domain of unknown function (DUF5658)
MKRLLFIIFASLLDGIFSLWLFSHTTAVETSPIMAYLLAWSPWAFITGKMLLTCGCGWVLYHLSKKFLLANIALTGITVIYGMLLSLEVAMFIF